MSEPKFTPGPWEIDERSDTWNVKGGKRCVGRVEKKHGAIWDAHLISAAPELFEALGGLVSICEDIFETGLPVDARDTDPYLLDAQDALAKALGEVDDE